MTKTLTAAERAELEYDAYRRAEALWAYNGAFYTGEFADSTPACIGADYTMLGWIAGTEDGNGTAIETELTDVESIDFMERPGFVLTGSPEALEAALAWKAAR
jgi:hypothetical protein